MPTAEWNVAFDLVTSEGTLLFNQGSYPRFNINRERCRVRRDVRATTDPIPQGDGDIFHERYATGIEMTINCQPWLSSEQFACEGIESGGVSLVTMRDDLYQHLWALLRPVTVEGTTTLDHRIIWTPTGQDRRMLDQIRLLSISDPTITKEGLVSFEFTVDTPFPYAMDLAQDTTTFAPGTDTIPNAGNVEFWPVIQVTAGGSAITDFTLESDVLDEFGNPLSIVWDSMYGGTSIGAGEYAEIDTFRGTIFLNGDEDDLSSSFVATESDFFPIKPDGTDVTLSGTGVATATFLTNNAWA